MRHSSVRTSMMSMIVPPSMMIMKWGRASLSTDISDAVGVTVMTRIGSPATGVYVMILSPLPPIAAATWPSLPLPGARIRPEASTRYDRESLYGLSAATVRASSLNDMSAVTTAAAVESPNTGTAYVTISVSPAPRSMYAWLQHASPFSTGSRNHCISV